MICFLLALIYTYKWFQFVSRLIERCVSCLLQRIQEADRRKSVELRSQHERHVAELARATRVHRQDARKLVSVRCHPRCTDAALVAQIIYTSVSPLIYLFAEFLFPHVY